MSTATANPTPAPPRRARPRLGVFKFSSCDGCQLSLLDCEDELLPLTDEVEIAYFLEATRRPLEGEFDLSLVEGSISTPEQEEAIQDVRRRSKLLITIGACASHGGIQGLRNLSGVAGALAVVYADPRHVETLERSRPPSDYVSVDLELQGCPIDKSQLLGVLAQVLIGARPRVPDHSLCLECKRRGVVCVIVAKGEPCMGPVVSTGCGVLCPSHDRPCYGCFGPSAGPNTAALAERFRELGLDGDRVRRLFHSYYTNAPAFLAEGLRHA